MPDRTRATPPAALAWLLARAAWLAPAFAAGVALVLRLYWVRHAILPAYGDQPSIKAFAANVAHGQAYGTHSAYWPPAFIFFAGTVERLLGTGHALLAVRSADGVLGALTAAVTVDLGRRLLRSARAGLLAGLLFALYVPAIYYTNTVLAVTLGTLLLVSVLDATYDNRRTTTPSGQTVLDHLGEIHTDLVQEHGETVRVIKLPPAARRVLDLLGIPIAAFADDAQRPRP